MNASAIFDTTEFNYPLGWHNWNWGWACAWEVSKQGKIMRGLACCDPHVFHPSVSMPCLNALKTLLAEIVENMLIQACKLSSQLATTPTGPESVVELAAKPKHSAAKSKTAPRKNDDDQKKSSPKKAKAEKIQKKPSQKDVSKTKVQAKDTPMKKPAAAKGKAKAKSSPLVMSRKDVYSRAYHKAEKEVSAGASKEDRVQYARAKARAAVEEAGY